MLNMQSHSINDRRGSKRSARSVISSLRFDLMPRKLTRKLCCIIRRTFSVALYLRSPSLTSSRLVLFRFALSFKFPIRFLFANCPTCRRCLWYLPLHLPFSVTTNRQRPSGLSPCRSRYEWIKGSARSMHIDYVFWLCSDLERDAVTPSPPSVKHAVRVGKGAKHLRDLNEINFPFMQHDESFHTFLLPCYPFFLLFLSFSLSLCTCSAAPFNYLKLYQI